jgi:hypothetical protein
MRSNNNNEILVSVPHIIEEKELVDNELFLQP